jgi:hypothetical protein
MKLKIFINTTEGKVLLPCRLFLQRTGYCFSVKGRKKEASNATRILKQMLKVEKDSQKWTYDREDENYLYYKWERKKGTTYYKIDKRYWVK